MQLALKHALPCVLLAAWPLAAALAAVGTAVPDPRHLSNGWTIPSSHYANQPYIVRTDDGAWLCVITTGSGVEGAPGQLRALGVGNLTTFDYREHLKANGVPDAATYRTRYRTLPLTPAFTDFQIESMRAFFKEFRARLAAWSPDKTIPVSVNGLLTPLRPEHVLPGVDVVDFLHGESSQNADYQTAAEYIFGTREQYGDLYDFVYDHRGLLDALAPAVEIGVLINGDEPGPYLAVCQKLAALQLPCRIVLGASRHARVPVTESSLGGLRLLVEASPASSFCAEDRAALEAARGSGLVRFAPATADLAALGRLLKLALLRLEGPDNLYAFLRVDRARRTAVVQVVNWNVGGPGAERAEPYGSVTVSLLQPGRWGTIHRQRRLARARRAARRARARAPRRLRAADGAARRHVGDAHAQRQQPPALTAEEAAGSLTLNVRKGYSCDQESAPMPLGASAAAQCRRGIGGAETGVESTRVISGRAS